MPTIDDAKRAPARHKTYASMRLAGRVVAIRRAISRTHRVIGRRAHRSYLHAADSALESSLFDGCDPDEVVADLRRHGIALGLDLPTDMVDQLCHHAAITPCFADRDPALGFVVNDRELADQALGKPVLVAQHFNVLRDCRAAARVAADPLIQVVAARYLGVVPRLVGASMWWTFPVDATAEDRFRHAHQWHRDLDDVRFLKFFFYLTDVEPGDGAHMCVVGSHLDFHGRPRRQAIRRHTEAEVDDHYRPEHILEICGPAGTGFAETTLCLHRGRTPTQHRRLLLQLEFAHFDYGLAHDHRPDEELQMLVSHHESASER